MESLQVYDFNLKLKLSLQHYVARNILEDSQFEAMQSYYKSVDTESTGKVQRHHIVQGFRELQGIEYSEDKLEYLINRTDKLGSGDIDHKEFLMSVVAQNKVDNEERIQRAFAKYDADGKLDVHSREVKELLKYIEDLNPSQVTKIVKEVDKFTKSTITYKDFLQIVRKALDL